MVEKRIRALVQLGEYLTSECDEVRNVSEKAWRKNKWFTPEYIHTALQNISLQFLSEDHLRRWLDQYEIRGNGQVRQTVGIIMAGNLPLVGFHDLLCAYISGFKSKLKLSSKDDVLLPHVLKQLAIYDPLVAQSVEVVEVLKDFDAVIATGSNNSNRYFEYYFRDKPKILRQNRHSAAILTGTESAGEIESLADDVFLYWGLGCRNVSKLFLPRGYTIEGLLEGFEKYKWTHEHTPYKNNYDYNRTLLLMNNTPHYANDFIMLSENELLASPLASLHYEYYSDEKDLAQKVERHRDELQCLVGKAIGGMPTIDFGKAQAPELWDYADGVDVMEWLSQL